MKCRGERRCYNYQSEENRGLGGQTGKCFVLDKGIPRNCVERLLCFEVGRLY